MFEYFAFAHKEPDMRKTISVHQHV